MPGELSDDALLLAYAGGNTAAFETLLTRYRARVFGFLRRVLPDDALAEDALVETFLKVHGAASTFEPRGAFKPWLFQIAYREGLKVLRQHRRREVLSSSGEGALGEHLDDGQPSPEAIAIGRERLLAVDGVLSLLPENHRAVFLLFYGEGLSTAQIAESLNLNASSVRSYLTLARQAIRQSTSRDEDP